MDAKQFLTMRRLGTLIVSALLIGLIALVYTGATVAQTSICDQVEEIPLVECEALEALYQSTNGPNWINNDGWLTTNTPCSWAGVSCGGGHVTWLIFNTNGLEGNLPQELTQLDHLIYIEMRHNSLGTIPPWIGQMNSLQQLILEDCQLSGSIPPELGQLPNLEGLRLTNNQFSGSIPSELGDLPNLWMYLSLDRNQLTGSIPPELGNLRLEYPLDLSDNQLTGTIPPELGLVGRIGIYLDHNQLTGTLPDTFGFGYGGAGGFHEIVVNNNPLSGPLPMSLIAPMWTGLWIKDTQLCEPPDPLFQDWMNSPLSWQDRSEEERIICEPQIDSDGDGVPDDRDAFPNDPTEWTDSDEDGVGDNSDNCQYVANADQQDFDGDSIGDACDPDDDNDGVADGDDAYPTSNMSETVCVGGCDSGVTNQVLSTGASFMDLIMKAADAAKNHGEFVSAVSHLTNQWKADGLISGRDKAKITSCAS